MKTLKYSLLVLLCLTVWPAAAQVSDVSRLSLQRRYRPSDQPAAKGRFISDMYVWAHGSYYHPFVQDYGYGPVVTAGVGKWFSDKNGLHRYHGIRLGLGGGYFMDNYEGSHLKMLEARASYLFDLGAYVNGYHPGRIVSLIPLAGLGFTLNEGATNAQLSKGLSAHLGADIEFHLYRGVDLVIEPVFEFQQDPRKLARQDIWRKYYPVFRGDIGMNFQLDRDYWRRQSAEPADWRWNLSGGPRVQFAPLLFDAALIQDFPQMLGWDISAGLSRKYNPWFYLRVQAGFAKDYWWRKENNATLILRKYATHMTGRLDAMFDILGLFPSNAGERRLGLLLFAGPEAGILKKEGVNGIFRQYQPFIGAQGGVQLRLSAFQNWAAYLDPRVGLIPYSATSNSRETQLGNYSDWYGTVSLGVEYAILKRSRPARIRPSYGSIFRDLYLWAQGACYRPLVQEYGYGPLALAGVGKWFTDREGMRRMHGFRIGAGGGYFLDNKHPNHAKLVNLYASYLFDLSSCLYGFDPERDLSIIPLLGLGYGRMERTRGDLDGESLSAHLGLQLNVPLRPGVELVTEPLLELQQNARETASGKYFTAFRGNVGVNYQLDRKYWKRMADPGEDWRVQLSAGTHDLAAGVARKYSDWFYFRFQGLYGKDKTSSLLAANLSAMFDLLGISGKERRLGLLLFAGPEAGLVRMRGVADLENYHPFIGAQGGVQLRCRVLKGLSLYAEPRAGLIPYQTTSQINPREFANYCDVYAGLSLGLEYTLGQ